MVDIAITAPHDKHVVMIVLGNAAGQSPVYAHIVLGVFLVPYTCAPHSPTITSPIITVTVIIVTIILLTHVWFDNWAGVADIE